MRVEIDLSDEELAREEWRTIPSYPLYDVSNLARVRRASKKRTIAQFLNKTGYATAALSVKGTLYTRLVHVLVAEAFIGPKDADSYVAHLDGNKLNNVPSNLAYVTAFSYAGTKARNLGTQVKHIRTQNDLQAMREGFWHLISNTDILAISDSRESLLTDLNRMKDEALRDSFIQKSVVYAFEEAAFLVYESGAPVRVISLIYKPRQTNIEPLPEKSPAPDDDFELEEPW
jgi:hypothetical protein